MGGAFEAFRLYCYIGAAAAVVLLAWGQWRSRGRWQPITVLPLIVGATWWAALICWLTYHLLAEYPRRGWWARCLQLLVYSAVIGSCIVAPFAALWRGCRWLIAKLRPRTARAS